MLGLSVSSHDCILVQRMVQFDRVFGFIEDSMSTYI